MKPSKKELAETLCYAHSAFLIVQQEKKMLEDKLEKIKEVTETALKANYCNNCDGVGLPECQDTECHTYALDKIMSIIEGEKDEIM